MQNRTPIGAEGFRRAWEAALDFGVARLKDVAFERAIDRYLVPVFVAGKLMGFRRRHNDALLMFCLRHRRAGARARGWIAAARRPSCCAVGRFDPVISRSSFRLNSGG